MQMWEGQVSWPCVHSPLARELTLPTRTSNNATEGQVCWSCAHSPLVNQKGRWLGVSRLDPVGEQMALVCLKPQVLVKVAASRQAGRQAGRTDYSKAAAAAAA
eukprot:scaffold34137_cov21-Tisochrysis_lutea.AAC.1